MKILSVYPDLGFAIEINIVLTNSDFTTFSDFMEYFTIIVTTFLSLHFFVIKVLKRSVAYGEYSNTAKCQQTLLII